MQKLLAPNGEYIPVPEGRVTTFGLTEEQNQLVKASFPTKDYVLLDTDVATDLIAVNATSQIINAAALDGEGLELIFDFYSEVINQIDGTIFWLGYPKPPHPLRTEFRCYQNFKELAERTELSLRTVQRYIATLQATGEWIEYDTVKKGWLLQNNISILFGDHLK